MFVNSNLHNPKLYPGIVFVDKLFCHYLGALVVILYCLGVLQTIQHALERIVKVVAHACKVHTDIELKRSVYAEISILARQMPIKGLFVLLEGGLLGK